MLGIEINWFIGWNFPMSQKTKGQLVNPDPLGIQPSRHQSLSAKALSLLGTSKGNTKFAKDRPGVHNSGLLIVSQKLNPFLYIDQW